MSARALCYTEPGSHPTNEDAFEIIQHPSEPSCWIGALADGQGGQSGGGEAARLACRVIMEAISAQRIASVAVAATWIDALRRADERVCADRIAGYTTLIGFAVAGGHVIGASNGDSALWLRCQDGSIVDVTEHQAKNPPIGSGFARPTPFAAKLSSSWAILAMSDGVWKAVGRGRVVELLVQCRGQALIDALLTEARLPWSGGLGDDFTAVMLEEQASPPPLEA